VLCHDPDRREPEDDATPERPACQLSDRIIRGQLERCLIDVQLRIVEAVPVHVLNFRDGNSWLRQSSRLRITNPSMSVQAGGVVSPVLAAHYAASADGQRFLVDRLLWDAGGTPLRVVLNWGAGR